MQRAEVERRPRKRLLERIYDLEREVTSVKSTMILRKKTLVDFIEVLRPSSFHVTDESRHSSFVDEQQYLTELIYQCDVSTKALENIIQGTRDCAEDVKRRVEAVQEDHGKAILVFTVITTVFLPLTFITGKYKVVSPGS